MLYVSDARSRGRWAFFVSNLRSQHAFILKGMCLFRTHLLVCFFTRACVLLSSSYFNDGGASFNTFVFLDRTALPRACCPRAGRRSCSSENRRLRRRSNLASTRRRIPGSREAVRRKRVLDCPL